MGIQDVETDENLGGLQIYARNAQGMFVKGGRHGPGRPAGATKIKRARAILRETLLPRLGEAVAYLMDSGDPEIMVETLRICLPFIEAQATVSVKAKMEEAQGGLAEQVMKQLWLEQQMSIRAGGGKPSYTDVSIPLVDDPHKTLMAEAVAKVSSSEESIDTTGEVKKEVLEGDLRQDTDRIGDRDGRE